MAHRPPIYPPQTSVIAPSILASDFALLAQECHAVLDAGADWLHVDVMDGHFVPNITIGIPVVAALRAHNPDAVLDVHLMIDAPDRYLDRFAAAGADILTIHAEATRHLHRTLQAIRATGARAGVALNPATPLSVLDHVLNDLDLILIMSVNPGFGGQSFIPETLPKLTALRALLKERGLTDQVVVEVDGGVKVENIGDVGAAGAQAFVAGSAIFKAKASYRETIDQMRKVLAEVNLGSHDS